MLLNIIDIASKTKKTPIEILKQAVQEAIAQAYDEGYKDGYCDSYYEDGEHDYR